MKIFLLIIVMLAISQASSFKYAGKYQLGKSTVEIREAKSRNGDLDFDFTSKHLYRNSDCGAGNWILKEQIKNNLVDYREDNGYGMQKAFEMKFTKDAVHIKFTDQYIANSLCGDGEGKAFSGKFVKIAK